MIQIIHYRDKCIGCDVCADQAPGRWAIDDWDGKSILLDARETAPGVFVLTTTDDEWEEAILTEENCPVYVIRVSRK
jgi:ferredoxin